MDKSGMDSCAVLLGGAVSQEVPSVMALSLKDLPFGCGFENVSPRAIVVLLLILLLDHLEPPGQRLVWRAAGRPASWPSRSPSGRCGFPWPGVGALRSAEAGRATGGPGTARSQPQPQLPPEALVVDAEAVLCRH
ncbi:hypothetical protein NDU88_003479 [Pleurodeles waltl]|uniref:Uncharacterized protein n=1 Tax=Pleurodeles waltl TaxID=8319 RepID=A0AAV7PA57_PLEWA|nr:hypothetical protein NDU88_003479 [Pleurodeles waltl]